MSIETQCNCCSCRCKKLEKELKAQRELAGKYKKIANYIHCISGDFDSLYNDVMNGTMYLGSKIQDAETELRELKIQEYKEQQKQNAA